MSKSGWIEAWSDALYGYREMVLIDVKYMMAEDMTPEERKELKVESEIGLIAIETTNPNLEVKGVLVKSYVERLLKLGE